MNTIKKEAIEFCLNKYVANRMVDIWVAIIITLGLAILIFPILIWLIYRYVKAKKQIKIIKAQIFNAPNFLTKVHAASTFNSLVIDVDGQSIEIPQVYFLFSKYSKKELVKIINDNN